jgi:hypothetical protein
VFGSLGGFVIDFFQIGIRVVLSLALALSHIPWLHLRLRNTNIPCILCQIYILHRVQRRSIHQIEDLWVASSHFNNTMTSNLDPQRSKNVKLVTIVACQSKQIEEPTNHNMLYELVRLVRIPHSLASFLNISIGFVKASIKGKEIVQQVHGDMAYENVALELNLQVDIKQEALNDHVFF